jgi:hypothetical protein
MCPLGRVRMGASFPNWSELDNQITFFDRKIVALFYDPIR